MAFDRLKKITETKTTPGTKPGTEVITDTNIQGTCDAFVKASKDFKNAKAALAEAQENLIEYVSPKMFDGLRKNNLSKTFKINETVMCIFKDQFKALSDDDFAEVTEILGKANVPLETLFKEKVGLSLKKNIQDDEQRIDELINKLGEDMLIQYFDVKQEVVAVSEMYKAVAKAGVIDDLQDIIERIRYKPSCKVG